ncbi:hypothetical protein FQR65_LT19575 [Abscondita terminalis]|nr:hypothetical protein FQR65_LT19575 [Abscondita terminalis]
MVVQDDSIKSAIVTQAMNQRLSTIISSQGGNNFSNTGFAKRLNPNAIANIWVRSVQGLVIMTILPTILVLTTDLMRCNDSKFKFGLGELTANLVIEGNKLQLVADMEVDKSLVPYYKNIYKKKPNPKFYQYVDQNALGLVSANINTEAYLKFMPKPILTSNMKDICEKKHKIPVDTLSKYLGGYVDMQWRRDPVKQIDTIVTYDLDDNLKFRKKECGRAETEQAIPYQTASMFNGASTLTPRQCLPEVYGVSRALKVVQYRQVTGIDNSWKINLAQLFFQPLSAGLPYSCVGKSNRNKYQRIPIPDKGRTGKLYPRYKCYSNNPPGHGKWYDTFFREYQRIGIQSLKIEFPDTLPGRAQVHERAYNAIGYTNSAYDGWIKNVTMKGCDIGIWIGKTSHHITAESWTLESGPGRAAGTMGVGHHGESDNSASALPNVNNNWYENNNPASRISKDVVRRLKTGEKYSQLIKNHIDKLAYKIS